MKPLIALSALLVTGFVTASSETASAVVYCQYIDYPASCDRKARRGAEGAASRARSRGRAGSRGRRWCPSRRQSRRPSESCRKALEVNRVGRR